MTKDKLGQLINLRKEIKELEERINQKSTVHPSCHAKLLEERKHMAESLENEIIEYINMVSDSKIRRMMQYKYVDGYTWQKIANIMHYEKSYPEKAVARYLKKHS